MGLKVRKNRAPPRPTGCPMQRCMEVLEGAWTCEIIWKLSGGPRRFGELQRDIARVSPKMLSQRLRKLEQKRVVDRKALPSSPPSYEYELTSLGKELLPVLDTIVKVGTRLQVAAESSRNLPESVRCRVLTPQSVETRRARTHLFARGISDAS